jgi:N-acetylneuraminate lyase
MQIVKDCAPDSTLIAHIGSVNEAEAAELAKCAEGLGYNAISSVAPFYYKFSFEEIKGYYNRLANSVDLPMLVYHFPAFSGVNMGANEISSLLNDERVLGLKFTSNDFFTLERCRNSFGNKIIFNGYDEMLLAGLSMGVNGAVGSTYNFMADKFVKIFELFNSGKIEEAQKLQREANEIISVICSVGVMQAEKEVLNRLGFDFGHCRKPFAELTDEQKTVIREKILPLCSFSKTAEDLLYQPKIYR